MDHDITPYVVHEELIEDHRTDGLRSGEGSIAKLSDGSLYLLYGKFEGPSDHDHANLLARRSQDGGRSWSQPELMDKPGEGMMNIMSTSLSPLQDGRLGLSYMEKVSLADCRPIFRFSEDHGQTWSKPVPVMERIGYHVVNNDRLVQLSTGRLLIPYAWHGRPFEGSKPSYCGCMISDDAGETWRQGEQEIKIEPDQMIKPKLMEESRLGVLDGHEQGRVVCQEPGVVEMLDGRVLMWARSPGGYAYKAISDDGGETWSSFTAITEFSMPNGPQSIKRLPDSKRLIMLYNDRDEVPFGNDQFSWRRPLTVAVSDDDAMSWRRLGLLEPTTVPSNCYYSICFDDENVAFSYYEGVMTSGRGNLFGPRNLASLKLKVVKKAFFELGVE